MIDRLRCAAGLGVAGLLLLVSPALAGEGAADAPELTLSQALDEALARNPELRAAQGMVLEAEARLRTARTYPFNPEVTVGAGRRRGAGTSTTDRDLGLAQELELGGKRRRRVSVASFELDAARERLRRAQRRVTAVTAAAFVLAVRGRESVALERESVRMARALLEIERKRFAAGDVTRIEVNLARARLGRAAQRLELAEGAWRAARAELARSIGLDPRQAPRPVGGLELPEIELAGRDELLRLAGERRSDLAAFRRELDAARSRIDLARRSVVPNLVAEVTYSREEGTDRILGGALGLSIPIFNRRRGEIAEARAAAGRVEAETEAFELRIRQEVEAALSRYRAAVAGARELETYVVASLEENLGLLERSFSAGKIGWTDVIVFSREFIDSRREYIDVLAEAWLAAIELDLASGAGALLPGGENSP